MGLAHNLGGWKAVVYWADIVGEQNAKVSRALRFNDGILVVSAPDAVWRHQLSLEADLILEKIYSFTGCQAVKKIHFVS
jgi:predicted nucleic acid-binding Zn ribbon protein